MVVRESGCTSGGRPLAIVGGVLIKTTYCAAVMDRSTGLVKLRFDRPVRKVSRSLLV